MKLEFCGKLDAPDWILSQLYHMSKWDKNHFEIVCSTVAKAIKDKGRLNEDSLFERLNLYGEMNARESTERSQATRLDIDDVRACFGTIHYISTGATFHRVDKLQLGNELEQLGLASEHAKLLCKHLTD